MNEFVNNGSVLSDDRAPRPLGKDEIRAQTPHHPAERGPDGKLTRRGHQQVFLSGGTVLHHEKTVVGETAFSESKLLANMADVDRVVFKGKSTPAMVKETRTQLQKQITEMQAQLASIPAEDTAAGDKAVVGAEDQKPGAKK